MEPKATERDRRIPPRKEHTYSHYLTKHDPEGPQERQRLANRWALESIARHMVTVTLPWNNERLDCVFVKTTETDPAGIWRRVVCVDVKDYLWLYRAGIPTRAWQLVGQFNHAAVYLNYLTKNGKVARKQVQINRMLYSRDFKKRLVYGWDSLYLVRSNWGEGKPLRGSTPFDARVALQEHVRIVTQQRGQLAVDMRDPTDHLVDPRIVHQDKMAFLVSRKKHLNHYQADPELPGDTSKLPK